MTVLSRVMAKLLRLRPAETHRVRVQRSLPIPMPDGVILLGDRYCPDVADADQRPILLLRSPYGRGVEGLLARLMAERGYQALAVSCRGTFGSGGALEPFFNEQQDGHAVLRWLPTQAWFSGKVGLFGPSYVGLTQWAVAGDPPPFVLAMAPVVTQSHFAEFVRPGGSFALESSLAWIATLEYQALPWRQKMRAMRLARKRQPQAGEMLRLADSDTALLGRRVPFFQDWLQHDDTQDAYWSRIDFGRAADRVPPAVVVAGWYDIFCEGQIRDFANLRAAGREARLVVGPWSHGSFGGAACAMRETLGWMDRQLRSTVAIAQQPPVRLFVMGAGQWRDFPQWPPTATRVTWHLHPGRMLKEAPAVASAPDRYVYDPADPTPVRGGRSLYGPHAGPKDNRVVESRADVLSYTSGVLQQDTTVIGSVQADLHVRSSLEHTDFFVRLCDVAPNGRSINLCDGLVRVKPDISERSPNGSYRVLVTLSPTANTFRRGHRIRVQISSGAHPLLARNAGTGEPVGEATRLLKSEQEILHDPDHPSAIELPLVAAAE